MKYLKKSFVLFGFLFLILGLSANASAQKVRLRSQINPDCGSSSNLKFADIYADGNIAVQGSYDCRGAFIYDISNPDEPRLASWYNPGGNQRFLEAIVVGNRGYFGSGVGGGGVHIVDLTNPYAPVLLGIVDSTRGNGHNAIHEMLIWGDYLIENFNGFSNKIIKVINISNPANPVFVRDINPTEVQWVHAMHIRGNRLFTSGWGNSSNRGRTEIYEISSIGTRAPTLLGFIEDTTSTTAGNNAHSSWTSEDGNYLYSCRETADGTGDVRVYNITNPAQPLLVNRLTMQGLELNAVTPHNPVVVGNYLYVAWYQAGLQIFDLTDPASPKRVGQYDTFQQAFFEIAKSQQPTGEPWDFMCGTNSLQNSLPTSFDGAWAVYPFLGRDKILIGDLSNGLIIVDASRINEPSKNPVSDFDGDGRTDFSVYTPNTGVWLTENSSNNSLDGFQFGISTDKVAAGDYDGDGKTDRAVWRESNGNWYIWGSSTGFRAVQFGTVGDVPVAGDYDADGKTDIAVWRPSSGTWYILQSNLGFRAVQWGKAGDRPFTGDYEGDGKTDLVVYRPSNGYWYVLQSSSSLPIYRQFGISTDKPLPGDFDGDGKSDFAVYRPAEGNWYWLNSKDNSLSVYNFGLAEDLPIPADYNRDGKTEVAVFRPSNVTWYRLDITNGTYSARVFGQSGDVPSPVSVQSNAGVQ